MPIGLIKCSSSTAVVKKSIKEATLETLSTSQALNSSRRCCLTLMVCHSKAHEQPSLFTASSPRCVVQDGTAFAPFTFAIHTRLIRSSSHSWSHVRDRDRIYNFANYPKISYPELYVLQLGYKHFFDRFKERCLPQQYVTMKEVLQKGSNPRGLKRANTTLN